jgi:hypothetical protein
VPLSAQTLFEELKSKFAEKELSPYGKIVPVPASKFQREWTEELQSKGCKVYSQSLNGDVYFFIKGPSLNAETKQKRRFWSDAEDKTLLELHGANISMSDIASKLSRSKAAVQWRLDHLRARTSNPQTEVSPTPVVHDQDNIVKEFLSACALLYPSHKTACAYLLKEASDKIMESKT